MKLTKIYKNSNKPPQPNPDTRINIMQLTLEINKKGKRNWRTKETPSSAQILTLPPQF